MKKCNIYILLGIILIASGLILTGYNIFQESSADEASKEVLHKLLLRGNNSNNVNISEENIGEYNLDVVDEEIDIPDYILNPDMDMPKVEISGSHYIGIIEFPSVGKILPVTDGCDFNKLKFSPCVYSGTAYLNNFIIVARNYKSHFGGIAQLPFGDKIVFKDIDGNLFKYSIVEKERIDEDDLSKISLEDWDLSLVTSSAGGTASMVLRCEKSN